MLFIKRVGNRYYKESRFDLRSLPIKRAEAEKLLAEGKAQLIERFLWEREPEKQEEVKPSNLLDITARIKANQEQQKTQEAVNKFMSEYLPNLSKEDMQTILYSKPEDFGTVITKICWRIDLERKMK